MLRWLVPGTVSTQPQQIAGSSGAVRPNYAVANSMSAMAAFPWVWTAVRAVAEDLAGLPLIAHQRGNRQTRRSSRRKLVDSTLLDQLQNPSPGTTEYLLRKQLLVDFLLTGNGYLHSPPELPGAHLRLHPEWCSPVPGPYGIPVGYELRTANGETQYLQTSEVEHFRDVSWSSDTQSLIGESAIRCLHQDLTVEQGHKELSADQAAKGQPDVVLSVTGGSNPGIIRRLLERWERSRNDKHSAFVVGDEVKVNKLSWTPDEIGSPKVREETRLAVLAVFEVPPARAGLVVGAYGTSKAQMRAYWESLIRRARTFDDGFSHMARRIEPGVRIRHDFTEVEALQISRTERLDRAVKMVQALGATPADAMSYEGFDEAPVPEEIPEGLKMPRPVDRPAEEPQEERTLRAALADYLQRAQGRYAQIGHAARAGADTALAVQLETEQLFGVLEGYLPTIEARRWAQHIAGPTVAAARLAQPGTPIAAFTSARAAELAARIYAEEAA